MTIFAVTLALLVVIVLYFLPALVAGHRKAENSGWIFLLNLLMGWTVIGWITAYVWAVADAVQLPPLQFNQVARQPRKIW